eukprot:GHVH01001554.1.p1 GENE.GHVH01001554.1~~GHVH01001554.1.p1  ORF type:complete len:350 (+),score=60.35 GHVH01001554.1:87-1136(+)
MQQDFSALKAKLSECETNLTEIREILLKGDDKEVQNVHDELIEAKKVYQKQLEDANMPPDSILSGWSLPSERTKNRRGIEEDAADHHDDHVQDVIHPDEEAPALAGIMSFAGQWVSSPQADGELRVGQVISAENDVLQVQYIGDDDGLLSPVPLHSVSVLRGLPLSAMAPGALVMSAYGEDGYFYDCTVKNVSTDEHGNRRVTVYYEEYDESETVNLERLQFRISSPGYDAQEDEKKRPTADATIHPHTSIETNVIKAKGFTFKMSGKMYVTPSGYQIPEELQIHPSDPDEVKEAKKAKVRSIKKNQRAANVQKECSERSTSWTKHAKKAQTRSGTMGSLYRSLAPTKR